jgi:hypothetical protein
VLFIKKYNINEVSLITSQPWLEKKKIVAFPYDLEQYMTPKNVPWETIIVRLQSIMSSLKNSFKKRCTTDCYHNLIHIYIAKNPGSTMLLHASHRT